MIIELDWRSPYLRFLTTDKLPEDMVQLECLKRKSANYLVVEGELYHRRASETLLKCILAEGGRDLLNQIHFGISGNHSGLCMLVGKAYRHGFFWLTAVTDSADIVQKCEGCQFFARQAHMLA